MELRARSVDAGAIKVEQAGTAHEEEKFTGKASTLPAKIVAYTTAFLGILMMVVMLMSNSQRIILAIFSSILLIIAGIVAFLSYRYDRMINNK
jgi:hypothetical protein